MLLQCKKIMVYLKESKFNLLITINMSKLENNVIRKHDETKNFVLNIKERQVFISMQWKNLVDFLFSIN